MDDLLGVPNERLKDLLAELPKGAYIWLEYIRNGDYCRDEYAARTEGEMSGKATCYCTDYWGY